MPPRSRLLGSAIANTQTRFYSAPAERSIPAAKLKYLRTREGFKPPKCFLAGSAFAGVKTTNTKYDDVALIVSEKPSVAAAVTTRNIFKAAPVRISRTILEKRTTGFHGVVINSGCANAVTGEEGMKHAVQMAMTADAQFGTNSREEENWTAETTPRTLVMSTGVIGQKLPIEKITQAIPKAHAALGSSYDHWMGAARAICTTDTFPKLLSRSFKLPSHPSTEYKIAGMTKGAGMIHPNMGTLLGVVCTDVSVNGSNLHELMTRATNRSFNSISIDGDTSTNDTVALLANGSAAPPDAQSLDFAQRKFKSDGEGLSEDEKTFYSTLTDFMQDLAKLVVRDGEGATKFITIRVQSAASAVIARRVAASIGTSALVKTALYGKDANWGRIVCAAGYAAGIIRDSYRSLGGGNSKSIDPHRTSVSLVPADGSQTLDLLINGEPQDVDEVRAKEILEHEDIEIFLKLDRIDEAGSSFSGQYHEATFYTCDFSVSIRLFYAQDIH